MTSIQSKYEFVLVISTKLGDEGIAEMVQKFKELIEANATLESVDEWGKRRLAYEIDFQSEGFYVLYTFTAKAEVPAEIDRISNITDGILRSMVIKKED